MGAPWPHPALKPGGLPGHLHAPPGIGVGGCDSGCAGAPRAPHRRGEGPGMTCREGEVRKALTTRPIKAGGF